LWRGPGVPGRAAGSVLGRGDRDSTCIRAAGGGGAGRVLEGGRRFWSRTGFHRRCGPDRISVVDDHGSSVRYATPSWYSAVGHYAALVRRLRGHHASVFGSRYRCLFTRPTRAQRPEFSSCIHVVKSIVDRRLASFGGSMRDFAGLAATLLPWRSSPPPLGGPADPLICFERPPPATRRRVQRRRHGPAAAWDVLRSGGKSGRRRVARTRPRRHRAVSSGIGGGGIRLRRRHSTTVYHDRGGGDRTGHDDLDYFVNRPPAHRTLPGGGLQRHLTRPGCAATWDAAARHWATGRSPSA